MTPTIYPILLIISWGIMLFMFLMSRRKFKNQEKYINQLIDEKSKMSDALRIKGCEVVGLGRKVKRLEKE